MFFHKTYYITIKPKLPTEFSYYLYYQLVSIGVNRPPTSTYDLDLNLRPLPPTSTSDLTFYLYLRPLTSTSNL